MTTDERLDALDGIIMNLTENPADQSEEFLALAMNKASQIKGLCEVERLERVLRD